MFTRPNDKHRLQEELWHLAFTTSTVAPLQVARLGWLPRPKLPLRFARTYGHLGSPILEPPLNAYSGNDGNPGIESTNIMLYNDLC